MTTYDQYINAPASEKVVLLWMTASQKLITFTNVSGDLYQKTVKEYTIDLYQDGQKMQQVATQALVDSVGKWFFDAENKKIYLHCFNDADPETVFMRADYRLFFSNAPYELPYDLDNGPEVEYIPSLLTTSFFGHEIDLQQFGTTLEGQGSITLINQDGFFDRIFEKYWFDNKRIDIFSWSPILTLSEKKRIYKGFIADKQLSPTECAFSLYDFIGVIQRSFPFEIISEADGRIKESNIGRPKRQIFGRVAGHQCLAIDCVLDGFLMSGTMSGAVGSNILTGSGTAFLDECSPDDTILHLENNYKIKSVDSNTQITISTQVDEIINAESLTLRPKIPWRKKNREWLIAGHALKITSSTIISIEAKNRITLASVNNFNVGDEVLINADIRRIRRVSGNQLLLEQNLGALPTIGDTVSKYPIQAVNRGLDSFLLLSDFDYAFTGGNALVVFDDLAEFNITKEQAGIGTVSFTNGSRIVTGTSTSFLADFKPRDWIRPNFGTWYEILSVDSDTQITLRVAFSQSNFSGIFQKKNIEFLNDNSIVTVDCFGRTKDGTSSGDWIKTGPEAIEQVLKDIGLEDDLDAQTFTDAAIESPQTLSLKLPLEFNSQGNLTAKNVIDLINISCMCIVNLNQDFEIEINLLDSKKPPGIKEVDESDIISWESQADTTNVTKSVNVRYRHLDADKISGEQSFAVINYENPVSARLSDTEAVREIDIYFYSEKEAEIQAQRYCFYGESFSTKIAITTKLNLSTLAVGDKLLINFDRMINRIGSANSKLRIGIVTSVKKNGTDSIIEIDDIGGIFPRVANIADNASLEYATAPERERVFNGYFTDSNGIIDSEEETWRNNLIG